LKSTRAAASFRNLALNTFRLAERANIANARRDLRDLHDRRNVFAVHGIQQTMINPDTSEQRRGRTTQRVQENDYRVWESQEAWSLP
jgi:hypothetical protein